MENNKSLENDVKEIKKQNDKNLVVSGGYRSFFPHWNLRKLRCDNCNKVINNKTVHCLTTTEGQHICEECLGNYKKLMSQNVYDDYVRHLLGLNQNKNAQQQIIVANNDAKH